MTSNTLKLAAFAVATTFASHAVAQDLTLRWALHPGAEADAVVEYFAPKYEEETGIKVIGEILPPPSFATRWPSRPSATPTAGTWATTARAGSGPSRRTSST